MEDKKRTRRWLFRSVWSGGTRCGKRTCQQGRRAVEPGERPAALARLAIGEVDVNLVHPRGYTAWQVSCRQLIGVGQPRDCRTPSETGHQPASLSRAG